MKIKNIVLGLVALVDSFLTLIEISMLKLSDRVL